LKLIDANIFLELLLGRGKAQECRKFIEGVSRGDEDAAVTHFSIHSIEHLLAARKTEVAPFLRSVEQATGLIVYDTSLSDEVAASLLMKQTGLDFDDVLQYYVAKKLGAESIVSLDKDFDGLDLPRVEPTP